MMIYALVGFGLFVGALLAALARNITLRDRADEIRRELEAERLGCMTGIEGVGGIAHGGASK